jgi:hypothetical protein
LGILLTVIGVAALLYGTLSVLSKIPMRHRNLTPERVRALLLTLATRGEEGSFLLLRIRSDERFIQFKRYGSTRGDWGLRSDFPNAPWSRMYFDQVHDLAEKGGYEYARTRTTEGDVAEFLTLNFGQDIQAAVEFATTVSSQIYAVSLERDCVGILYGVRD